MRWAPQMSVQAVITQVPGTVGTMQQALHGCAWSGSMRLPSAFSSLSTFAVQDDKQQSWPVFEIAWLTVLPTRQTHRNYLLIGTAITIHYLLNLSACVILSNAFAPKKKKSPPDCRRCLLLLFFPGVRGEEEKETISLSICRFQSYMSPSWRCY